MLFGRLTQSITGFVRRSKKMKRTTGCDFMDETASNGSTTLGGTSPQTFGVQEVDQYAFLEDLYSAYHAPETLDIHRDVKNGLVNSPQLSASVFLPPTSVVSNTDGPSVRPKLTLKSLDVGDEIALVPRTPLLPSTPVFEDSLSISFDGPSSPRTSSFDCSTPLLSTPTSDVSAITLGESRIAKIEDFQLLQFLSRGICGQVHLVKDTISDRRLALKVMRKTDDIFKLPVMKEMLLQEKNIMVSLQGCEWFVQLEASWYDSHNIYFAMTYYPTDLESEIIRCEKLPEERARFYMAEMIIALEELHKRGIVHRDVKAANLLIGADGHIVLADFGLSKDFGRKPTDAERCYQPYWPFRTDDDVFRTPRRSPEQLTFVTDDICGSEVEMPPEILLEEYYSFGVDFWASGITLYLMVTGRHPWSEQKEKSIRQQILEDDVEFSPEDEVREECRDFIRQMLRKEPMERLRIGLDMISHPYFAGMDWVAMQNRVVSPPWVPDFVSGHFYCEEWGTVELFEPGEAVGKDEDELLPDFFFTSPELGGCAEMPLGNFFSYEPEQEEPVNDDEDDDALCSSDLEDENMSYEIVRPINEVNICFPTVSESDSHASMSPSFHSASSLVRLKDAGSLADSTQEVEPRIARAQHVLTSTPESGVLKTKIPVLPRPAICVEFKAVSPAGPVQFTRPVPRSFKPILEPIIESIDSWAGFAEHATSMQVDITRSDGYVNGVVSWVKNFLPWTARITQNVPEDSTA